MLHEALVYLVKVMTAVQSMETAAAVAVVHLPLELLRLARPTAVQVVTVRLG
jgi:hypothetical protein